jgi:excisionase family DNA binding protein
MGKRASAEATFENKIGLTINEAGEVIGIGRSGIYELIRAGRLPARKIGARTIILRDDAVAFVRSLPTVQPKAA